MGHIFISYSHKDSSYVHKLVDALEEEGFEVWIDDRIHYGSEWPKVVTRNLDVSDGVIIVMSNNSYESDMVQNEIARAREKKKTIFPLLLEGDNWLIVQAKQFVDVRDESVPTEKFYKRLEEVTQRKDKKTEREAAERIAQEEAAREQAKKDAEEKARLEAEKQARQKIGREKKEREAAEKVEREKTKQETAEKSKPKAEKPKPIEEKPRFISTKKGIPIKTSIPLLGIVGGTGVLAIIGISLTIFIIWLSSLDNKGIFSTSVSTPTRMAETQVLLLSTETLTPNSKPMASLTFTPTFTPTSLQAEITDAKGVSMLLVPAGKFVMGSSAREGFLECSRHYSYCYESGFKDVEPAHKVYLDAFYIDKYEVTNAQYKVCVEQGACEPPRKIDAQYHSSYYDNTEFAEYPVVNVDWKQSQDYCEWRQSNLPTEAQWEKAARSDDNRTYSWGEDLSCQYANYAGCEGDLTAFGSYEDGKSPYGVYEMIGNVSEWVADWYSETYYSISPIENPLGPESGQFRVMRGGSYGAYVSSLMTYSRSGAFPDRYSSSLGFRCAKEVTQ